VAAGIDQGHEVPNHEEIKTISRGFSGGGLMEIKMKKRMKLKLKDYKEQS